ncbi:MULTISPECIES: acyl-CoA synthetase [unclassified Rhodococcus (in: high G+C Gram-positive bacteria)]|uniref:acyl-CoA synthetase n=1 Tax=unclassified Rhodococcus (in: high G+C Gram-positive bacteria) TaxID=192944 RepID=UPI00163AF57F|nr:MULTISPECIES: acyl-CoA synthetase [unclassified Rhodococcus (in: high G+C Gram-positive bacteria)]MBC2642632.1 acyl-CoA synthetase [Rhodococcus sp. 3A]MBC2892626.1 acyl-CoA synthetase [Rhodococcus sp. 4CII]
MTTDLLWPRYAAPTDLTTIEAVPLRDRGLPESTYALLTRSARMWPDRLALTVLPDGARWREPLQRSFSELLDDVHRYANLLHRLGVRRRDTVALMAPNCAELIPATLAAQLAGVAAPVNAAQSQQHIAELLRRSGARVLVAAGPELAPDTWAAALEVAVSGRVDAVLVLRPTGAAGAPADLPEIDGVRIGYLGALSAEIDPSDFVGDPPRGCDVAALFHTGGTTGVPKLAAHTHDNEVANAWMLAANSLGNSDSVVFAALPLSHVNALMVTLLAPLLKGQKVVWAGPLGYRDPILSSEFWKIVEHYRIVSMSAVPTVYAALAQRPVDADISSLRFAMVGASPLPTAVNEKFQKHTRVPLLEGYGLTEATCASARSFPDAPRPGSVGLRMPYQQVKVVRVREDGIWEDLPTGATGVLAISGPTVFAGYVAAHDEHGHVLDGMGTLVDGWLDTGDLARIDSDGFIYLAGRAKDIIIRGGHNIDPAVIEDALLAHPQVTAVSAVGRPDAYAGEVPVAYVTVATEAAITDHELQAWAGERVPERAAAPKSVTILPALPVTAVGKPYKLALRADATRRELEHALAAIAGIADIQASVEDGAILSTVEIDGSASEPAITAILNRYAINWKVTVRK